MFLPPARLYKQTCKLVYFEGHSPTPLTSPWRLPGKCSRPEVGTGGIASRKLYQSTVSLKLKTRMLTDGPWQNVEPSLDLLQAPVCAKPILSGYCIGSIKGDCANHVKVILTGLLRSHRVRTHQVGHDEAENPVCRVFDTHGALTITETLDARRASLGR